MDANAMNIREQYWLQSIRNAAQSGLTKQEWCRQNGISPATFYRWSKLLRDKALALQPAAAQFAALRLPLLQMAEHPSNDHFIVHRNEMSLEIPAAASEEQLSRILRVLHNAW